jgi:hypothetical protein
MRRTLNWEMANRRQMKKCLSQVAQKSNQSRQLVFMG